MKTIQFKNQRLNVPTSWNEITLGEYEQWNTNENHLQYLASVCKTDISILQEADDEALQEIEACLSFIFDVDITPSESVEIDGVTYYITTDDDIRIGTVMDMETLHKEKQDPRLSSSLALLCKPLGETYDAKIAKLRGQLFRAQTCEKMLPLICNFSQREQNQQKVWLDSAQVLSSINQFVQESKDFIKNENNMKQLPSKQTKRYLNLIESLETQLAEF